VWQVVSGEKSNFVMGGYMNQYGLTKLTVIGCFIVAVCSLGFLGVGGFGGTPRVSACKKGSMTTVFAAAPDKITRVVPENLQLARLYAPPPYFNVALAKTQFLQFNPSNSWGTPEKMEFSTKAPESGGTTGTPPVAMAVWENRGCSRVDAWFPESIKNALQAPTINDANATVTLDITPPSGDSRGDCAVWVYHYGNPPSKPIEANKSMVASESESTATQLRGPR
jgi:hypothetical protein